MVLSLAGRLKLLPRQSVGCRHPRSFRGGAGRVRIITSTGPRGESSIPAAVDQSWRPSPPRHLAIDALRRARGDGVGAGSPGGRRVDDPQRAGATNRGQALAESIQNTCVLRISRCFNYSGNPIPRSTTDEILTIRGGDGMNYAVRVHEFLGYLRRKYGPPSVEHAYSPPGGGEVPAGFKGKA